MNNIRKRKKGVFLLFRSNDATKAEPHWKNCAKVTLKPKSFIAFIPKEEIGICDCGMTPEIYTQWLKKSEK